jgi:hypothetical protein
MSDETPAPDPAALLKEVDRCADALKAASDRGAPQWEQDRLLSAFYDALQRAGEAADAANIEALRAMFGARAKAH